MGSLGSFHLAKAIADNHGLALSPYDSDVYENFIAESGRIIDRLADDGLTIVPVTRLRGQPMWLIGWRNLVWRWRNWRKYDSPLARRRRAMAIKRERALIEELRGRNPP